MKTRNAVAATVVAALVIIGAVAWRHSAWMKAHCVCTKAAAERFHGQGHSPTACDLCANHRGGLKWGAGGAVPPSLRHHHFGGRNDKCGHEQCAYEHIGTLPS